MKKLFLCVFTLIFIIFSSLNASATDNINFVCEDASCDTNRLVTINVKAECGKKLCAATFDFSFDNDMFEYRSVKSGDDTAIVKARDCGSGEVKVEYLSTYGKDISDETVIFTITLKAVKSGAGYLDFSVRDCVDSDVEFISIGKCTSAKLTVNGKSTSSAGSKSGSASGKSSSKSKDSSNSRSGKSSREGDEDADNSATYDELGTVNPLNNSDYRFLIAGVIIGAVVIIFIVAAFLLGRRAASKNKNSKTNDRNNNSDEE